MNSVVLGILLAVSCGLAVFGLALMVGNKKYLQGVVFLAAALAVFLAFYLVMNRDPEDVPQPSATPEIASRETPENTDARESELPSSTDLPQITPSPEITTSPTDVPTEKATEKPTERPTEAVTQKPTEAPTEKPTSSPSGQYISSHYDPSTAVKPDNWNGSTIYLTFDDGPSYNITPQVLDVLKKYGIKATFFVVRFDDDVNKISALKRTIEEGHSVGLHSYSHDYSVVYASDEAYYNDIVRLDGLLKEKVGYEATVLRFPGGASNTISKNYSMGIMSRLAQGVQERGYAYCDWNVSPEDSVESMSAEQISDAVISALRTTRDNFVLLHDYSLQQTTVDSLETIIQYALKEGYAFDRLTPEAPLWHHTIAN